MCNYLLSSSHPLPIPWHRKRTNIVLDCFSAGGFNQVRRSWLVFDRAEGLWLELSLCPSLCPFLKHLGQCKYWILPEVMDIDPAGLYYGIQLLLNFITFTCSVELHIMHDVYQFNIQLALEKCELELHGSTYKQIFFNSEYWSTTWSVVGWLHGYGGTVDLEGQP